jgi:ABC-type bacteriocin/lantibiotic exporter with double-glycine peptidase domain
MRLLPALLAAVCLAGCSSSQFHSAEELRGALSKDSVVLQVQPVADDAPGQCGLACLESLLRFHGLELDAAARARFPKEAKESGSIAAGDIRDYLRGRGLRAHLVHGSLDEQQPKGILYLLRQSLPVIVALKLESGDHYALVCGFDQEHSWVFIMDPARGIGGVPYDKFDEYWKGADRLMLVAARVPASDR